MDRLLHEMEYNMHPVSLRKWNDGKIGEPILKYGFTKYFLVRWDTNIPNEYYYQVWHRGFAFLEPVKEINMFSLGWVLRENSKWMPIVLSYDYNFKYNTFLDNLIEEMNEILFYRWRDWDTEAPNPKEWKCILARYSKDKPKYDVLIYDNQKGRSRWKQRTNYEMSGRQKVKYYEWMPLEKNE